MRKYFTLVLIVVLAAVLRFTLLTYNPPSLNWDEISHGYNAYSISKTGMDQWGQKFPVINFRAYGDYPTTLNLYLTIPFMVIFGLTEFAIRFPHTLLGILTVISVYFLAWGLTKRKDVSLLSAFLVAVTPWYVFTSRFVVQSNLSVFLLTTAAAFFVNRDKNKNFKLITYSLLLLTLFSYHTTRIFSPLFLLGIALIYRKTFSWILVALFFLVTAIIYLNPNTWARSGVLSIINESAVSKIIEVRNKSNLPKIVNRFLYNRPVYFVSEFSKNYISYFFPGFLFLEGGSQYQFSVPKTGLLYLINLPFFYLGLILLFKKEYRLLLLWLVLAPIPASLTNERLTVIRATTMLPVTEIITALGFYFLIGKISIKFRLFTTLIYIIIVTVSLGFYLTRYLTNYRVDYSWSWQYGYKEAVSYAKENYDKYDKIIVTKKYGEPHEFFLFFWPHDPVKYQNDKDKIAFYQSNWWWVDRFDKFYFVNDWQISQTESGIWNLESGEKFSCEKIKCLLITGPNNHPENWSKLETINFLDNKPAFEIYENNE